MSRLTDTKKIGREGQPYLFISDFHAFQKSIQLNLYTIGKEPIKLLFFKQMNYQLLSCLPTMS